MVRNQQEIEEMREVISRDLDNDEWDNESLTGYVFADLTLQWVLGEEHGWPDGRGLMEQFINYLNGDPAGFSTHYSNGS